MTPSTDDRPQMLVEEFEDLARTAPETVTVEFIDGKLEVKPVPDGDHNEIIAWLQRQCMQHRPDLWLHNGRGLKIGGYRRGRARPDGSLAPDGHFAGHGEWSDPDGVLMTVEVTSHDADTNSRDRVEKRDGYAAAGIPVYLLIDRDACLVTAYSRPRKGAYHLSASAEYGESLEIPEPVGLTLDTERLKDFAA